MQGPLCSGTGLAGDRQEREELQLHPGRGAAAADGRRAVPPAERHGVCAHGQDLPCDFQVRQQRPGDKVAHAVCRAGLSLVFLQEEFVCTVLYWRP